MKQLKVVSIIGIILLIGILVFVYYLAPHFRSLKSDSQVRVIAKYNHVECGETCASFTISKIIDEFPFSASSGLYIFPYKTGESSEQIFESLSPNDEICLTGFSHLYSKGFGSLFKVGYGGYRFQISSWNTNLEDCRR